MKMEMKMENKFNFILTTLNFQATYYRSGLCSFIFLRFFELCLSIQSLRDLNEFISVIRSSMLLPVKNIFIRVGELMENFYVALMKLCQLMVKFDKIDSAHLSIA